MAEITTYLSITTLKTNFLNYPINRVVDWTKKIRLNHLLPTRNVPFWPHRLKIKEWKKIFQEQPEGVAYTHISKCSYESKLEETKKVIPYDKGKNQAEGYCNSKHIGTDVSIPNFIKQKLLYIKSQIDPNTIIV
jgi:hypothetical protein